LSGVVVPALTAGKEAACAGGELEILVGNFAQLSNGTTLHYASCGRTGAPLALCLHGFPEYWAAWEDLMPALARDHFVVAPDLRGFNLSSQPTAVASYRAREIVADLALLIAALGYARADVAAHDWGGAAAWQLAIVRPDLVERLAIVNSPHPVPFARDLLANDAQRAASRYMNWLRAAGSEVALAENNFHRLLDFFARMARADAQWLSAERVARYRAVWQRGLTGGVNYYRASPLYPRHGDDPGAEGLHLAASDFVVNVPTLVLWGMADTALLPGLLAGLDELVPDLAIERRARATHWLLHEEPQFAGERIAAFFRSQ
jgi:pimeloyl-ACP methyl ester carboxylesterase